MTCTFIRKVSVWFCGVVMKHQLSALCLFLLFAFSAGIAQQGRPSEDESPLPDGQVLGSQLIAWSEMQEPQPLQQSPSQTPTPEQKPSQPPSASQSPDRDQQVQPAAQSFTGTISKEGDTYVPKVSDTSSYKLDDQDKAKQYEGQRVRVFGSLESSSNLIRVQRIEPIS